MKPGWSLRKGWRVNSYLGATAESDLLSVATALPRRRHRYGSKRKRVAVRHLVMIGQRGQLVNGSTSRCHLLIEVARVSANCVLMPTHTW